MKQKLLSIIVPSYNMEAYLPKCLKSLVIEDKALFQKLDVIVVNDGSRDHTSNIAHGFEAEYPDVFRVIDKPNGNYGSCINVALPLATGRFVKVLDADDFFDELGFARFVEKLEDYDADLVITDYDMVDADSNVLQHYAYDFPQDLPFQLERFGECENYISMPAFTYRTDMIRSIGYTQMEGISYSDTEWILLPLAGVRQISYCSETVYRALRGRAGQTMETARIVKNFWMRAELALDMLQQFEQLRSVAEKAGIDYLLSRLDLVVSGVYRVGVFGYNGISVDFDMQKFDATLKETYPGFYARADSAIYSKRIPYHFIRGWRRKSILQPLHIAICKAYSWLVS